MMDGLIHSYSGRMLLIAVWAALGFFGAIALTVVILLRKAPPLTTQTDHTTGVKEHGLGRWLVTLLVVALVPPLITAAAVTVAEVIHRAPVWVWPVGAAVGLTIGVVYFAVRRSQDNRARMAYPPPEPPQIAAQPPQMWSAPIGPRQQWDTEDAK